MNGPWRAFYSETQCRYGLFVYRRADGAEVTLTEVSVDLSAKSSFPDAEDLGIVVEWVRTIQRVTTAQKDEEWRFNTVPDETLSSPPSFAGVQAASIDVLAECRRALPMLEWTQPREVALALIPGTRLRVWLTPDGIAADVSVPGSGWGWGPSQPTVVEALRGLVDALTAHVDPTDYWSSVGRALSGLLDAGDRFAQMGADLARLRTAWLAVADLCDADVGNFFDKLDAIVGAPADATFAHTGAAIRNMCETGRGGE